MAKPNRYSALIETIFFDHFDVNKTEFEFARPEMKATATLLGIALPDNLGDVTYSFRFRNPLPQKILDTQPDGKEWVIELAGRARYRFKLVTATRITPRTDLVTIAIPDATP